MGILGELFTSAEMSGSVYLTNNQRLAFGCDSVVPMKVAVAKAKAWSDRTGKSVYIDGIGHIGDDPHIPDPDPDPFIGEVTATGDDLTGTSLALTVGGESEVTAAFSGDAEDVTFKWTISSGTAVSIVGDSTAAAVKFQGDEAGDATLVCTCSSDTAADSPQDLTITAAVAEDGGDGGGKAATKTRSRRK